ncbi:hypothetical protein FHW12_000318 [Dokdonella fugitiva]|uniref:Uncharacterized protein n=1 Tax=Dokdonella fugitiva TaxID=328517 RepID=A0A839EPA2_9GAMM|nr:hypothetical protein [Dokdonella fugitiva]MBA8886127.1 hypothetical protein [Dokdonella fugitiva]
MTAAAHDQASILDELRDLRSGVENSGPKAWRAFQFDAHTVTVRMRHIGFGRHGRIVLFVHDPRVEAYAGELQYATTDEALAKAAAAIVTGNYMEHAP